ncbi:hypothetical protein L2U69_12730 [Zavarzinia compransoris]|uniref:hypothetical protein n=1 Tax=Zavarzinia marina TaxID=2911065 RepID=UPI001F31B55C|nr:hypothetical protein [Zavarzinia marina]MCF4166511.1 hypothetical protein [Zavarzinia marina]
MTSEELRVDGTQPGRDAVPGLRAALAADDGLVFLDFDYALFGSSSTEEYLRRAWPGPLVSIVLALVRDFMPWGLLLGRYGYRVRDYIAIMLVTVLAPWNILLWRWRAPALFARHAGHPLAALMRGVAPERVVIVSFGLDFIVAPLLKGSPFAACRRVCVPALTSFAALRRGKLSGLSPIFGADRIAGAVAITDSEDDRDLLDAVRAPFLIAPTGPRVVAEEGLYFPMRYTARAKYGRFYVLYNSLLRELPMLALATWPERGPSPLWAVAVALLYASMLAIYEIGYFENDFVAAKHEARPVVQPESSRFEGFSLEPRAWAWGGVLGLLGCLAAVADRDVFDGLGLALAAGIWLAVLVVTRLLFHAYNTLPVQRRVLLYPVMQAAKLFGMLLVLPGHVFGAALLLAQVVAMWITYAIYRTGGDKSAVPRDYARPVLFAIFALALALVLPVEDLAAHAPALTGILVWFGLFLGLRGAFMRVRDRRPA